MASDASKTADLEARLRLAVHEMDVARIEAGVTRLKYRELRAKNAHMVASEARLKGKVVRHKWENEYLKDKLKTAENALKVANLKLKDAEPSNYQAPWELDQRQKTRRRSAPKTTLSETFLQAVEESSEFMGEPSTKRRRVTKDPQQIIDDVKMRLLSLHMQELPIQEKRNHHVCDERDDLFTPYGHLKSTLEDADT